MDISLPISHVSNISITNGWNPEHIVYCVDVRQELHFRQLSEVARKWIASSTSDKNSCRLPQFTHVKNGFLKLKDGAMSTRKGNIIRLQALIEEAISRVEILLQEKVILSIQKTSKLSPLGLSNILISCRMKRISYLIGIKHSILKVIRVHIFSMLMFEPKIF